MKANRREFIGGMVRGAVPALLVLRQQDPQRPTDSTHAHAGGTQADTLVYPLSNVSAPLGPLDNDPGVISIERRLHCKCGCTLDVYTCRTTDFSCTFSPAMHRDVVAQVQRGASADQILQWFVANEGEKVLMAPAARGFNILGYIVPGLSVLAVGLALIAWLVRKDPHAAPVPLLDAVPPAPDADQLARLRRDLANVDS